MLQVTERVGGGDRRGEYAAVAVELQHFQDGLGHPRRPRRSGRRAGEAAGGEHVAAVQLVVAALLPGSVVGEGGGAQSQREQGGAAGEQGAQGFAAARRTRGGVVVEPCFQCVVHGVLLMGSFVDRGGPLPLPCMWVRWQGGCVPARAACRPLVFLELFWRIGPRGFRRCHGRCGWRPVARRANVQALSDGAENEMERDTALPGLLRSGRSDGAGAGPRGGMHGRGGSQPHHGAAWRGGAGTQGDGGAGVPDRARRGGGRPAS
ncbi:hypothetical protein RLIN73S_05843 [Rhodanobacter lindaniclasticus]